MQTQKELALALSYDLDIEFRRVLRSFRKAKRRSGKADYQKITQEIRVRAYYDAFKNCTPDWAAEPVRESWAPLQAAEQFVSTAVTKTAKRIKRATIQRAKASSNYWTTFIHWLLALMGFKKAASI